MFTTCMKMNYCGKHITKKNSGFKRETYERLTIASCSNAVETHKLLTLVISKDKKPRPFKNTAKLRVNY